MRIVITGGHHSSAVPVIREILKREPNTKIFWIGHKYSLAGDENETLEYKEITSMGITFYELKTGKFYRNISIKAFAKIFSGFLTAYKMLSEIKPDVILSFGGYLAVPVVISAWIKGIPSITHEQTLVVGYANKVISMFAKKVLISFKESAHYFNSKKLVYTGLPLRESITHADTSNFHTENTLPYIYITGGKTGSHIINEIVGKGLEDLLSFANVIHQCGDYSVTGDFSKLSDQYEVIKDKSSGRYFLRKFIFEDEIGEAFKKASIVISRSGAHIISELAYLNKPSILIPIPWVSHDEQNLNATYLKEKGLAEIVPEKSLTTGRLLEVVQDMLQNIVKYKLKGTVPAFKQNSAVLIADEIFKVLPRR